MLSVISYFLCIFAITRQVPFYQLSKIISLSLILMFFFSIPFLLKNFWDSDKKIKYLFIINIIWLTLMLDLLNCHRTKFYVVSDSILFYSCFNASGFLFTTQRKYILNIFIVLAVLHSVLLIGFEIYIVLLGDPAICCGYIRQKVLSLGFGDIYTYNQYFYRIQIKGNPIYPLLFL